MKLRKRNKFSCCRDEELRQSFIKISDVVDISDEYVKIKVTRKERCYEE